MAQLVVLTCNSSGRCLVFATTHLKAEKTPEGEETRRIQAQQLLKEVLLYALIFFFRTTKIQGTQYETGNIAGGIPSMLPSSDIGYVKE